MSSSRSRSVRNRRNTAHRSAHSAQQSWPRAPACRLSVLENERAWPSKCCTKELASSNALAAYVCLLIVCVNSWRPSAWAISNLHSARARPFFTHVHLAAGNRARSKARNLFCRIAYRAIAIFVALKHPNKNKHVQICSPSVRDRANVNGRGVVCAICEQVKNSQVKKCVRIGIIIGMFMWMRECNERKKQCGATSDCLLTVRAIDPTECCSSGPRSVSCS